MKRTEIIAEMREVELDLLAFKKSRDEIQRRINDMEGQLRQEKFIRWAATQAILNTMILAITRCEGLLEDYQKILETFSVPDNVLKLERNQENDRRN